jgi:hypothetical protein
MSRSEHSAQTLPDLGGSRLGTGSRKPRSGHHRWGIVLVPTLLVSWAALLPAQQPKPAAESAKGGPQEQAPTKSGEDASAKSDAEPDPDQPGAAGPSDQGAVDTKSAKNRAGLEERYKDPNAEAALENKFPELFTRVRASTPADDRRIRAMASGQVPTDKTFLTTYVQGQVAQLTKRQNIEAMLNPSSDPRLARAIEEAGSNLLEPLLLANEANNRSFRADLTSNLVTVAPDVLKGHLYARLMLMMALSRSQDPAALPVFVQQLDNPDQVLTAKLLSAVGLTNLTQQGKQTLDPARAIQAAKALAGFLEREKDTFWPALYRALEAIGSIRQAESAARSPVSDIAATVLGFVADPDLRPEVRAEAAWSLGMLRPSAQDAKYNFELVAHHMAIAATEIAEKVAEAQANSSGQAARLADQLVQLYLGFEGDPALRAGILRSDHQNLSAQRGKIRQLADQVKAVAVAAVDLSRAPRAQQEAKLASLRGLISDLREYLAQNPPGDLNLYANGPSFPVGRPEEPEAAGPES